MNVTEMQQGAVTVLKPDGPLVGVAAEDFGLRMREVASESLGRLVLDASGVPLLDSKGLEALEDVSDEMADSGHVLKLCGANETLRQVLELTGLSGKFEYYDDMNSAVRSFS